MALSDMYRSALSIVNEVQRKLGLNPTANFEASKHARVLLDFLNDVIDEVSDYGDWPTMLRTTKVTAASSVHTYEVSASGNIKNIYEIAWGDQIAPLQVVTLEELRQLQRLNSRGKPRQFAVVGVSGADPRIGIHPTPVTADLTAETSAGGVLDVLYYKKCRVLTTADSTAAAIPMLPAKVLMQGVYAKALLDENGGEPTPNYQAAYAEYQRMRAEALNRLTADTGSNEVFFTPTGNRRG